MATFKKYEIGDESPVVLDLTDYLSVDHMCKQIENIVSGLDTNIIEAGYSSLGRNGLHPKLMLSVIFYGYITGIRSGRKLSLACSEQLPFIYLSKGYFPGKTLLNDFRKNNYQHFTNLFQQVLKKCLELEIADPKISINDGSKLRAHSSKKRTKDIAGFEKWQKQLLDDISFLEKQKSEEEALKKSLNQRNGLNQK